MNDKFYLINGTYEFNRKDFEEFLIDYIHDNELYELRGLLGGGRKSVKHHVKHHPLRLAREIFGEENVVICK